MKKYKIYLDDIRTPHDPTWKVVRDYNAFKRIILHLGLNNIEVISLDHDLGTSAINEYFDNVIVNYELNYDNIHESTGLDCAKWLVDKCISTGDTLPQIFTHSANPIGSANIMGYINAYLRSKNLEQTCIRIRIPHSIKKD